MYTRAHLPEVGVTSEVGHLHFPPALRQNGKQTGEQTGARLCAPIPPRLLSVAAEFMYRTAARARRQEGPAWNPRAFEVTFGPAGCVKGERRSTSRGPCGPPLQVAGERGSSLWKEACFSGHLQPNETCRGGGGGGVEGVEGGAG